LLQNLRFESRDLFARRVCFPNCRRVLIGLLRRHQVSIGAFGALFLLKDFCFQPSTFVTGIVPTLFHGANFKGALIELFFDLGAPVRDALYFGL
jgi:hypothetical protein